MVTFRNITEDNFDAVIAMKRPENEHFVASNAVSLAQAWLYHETTPVHPFAIYEGETLVGFMMLDEDPEERRLNLWRVMVPPEHQNKGYGTEAIGKVIGLARESEKFCCMTLGCEPDNVLAKHVYEKLGFRPTGEIYGGEIVMRLEF